MNFQKFKAFVRRHPVALGTAAAVWLIYALVGFFLAPGWIRSTIKEAIQAKTRRAASIREVRLNPLALSLTVRGLEIKDLDGSPFAGFEEFYINFELTSIFYRAATFREIHLFDPFGNIKIAPDGKLNFHDLIGEKEEAKPEAPAAKEAGGLPSVLVHLLELKGGRIFLHDETRIPASDEEFSPIEFTIRDFSTRRDANAPYAFAATTPRGEKIEWEGTFTADPIRSEGRFALTGLHLPSLWDYAKDRFKFELSAGTLDVSSRYEWDRQKGLRLSEGLVRVQSFELREKNGSDALIVLPALEASGIAVGLVASDVRIGKVASSGARILTRRLAGGVIEFAKVLALELPSATKVEESKESVEKESPWKLSVGEVDVRDYTLSFEDRTTAPPAQIQVEPISLAVKNFALEKGKTFSLSLGLGIGEKGRMEASGEVGLQPLSADLKLMLSDVPLAPLEPYIQPHARLRVRDGSARLEGRFRLENQTKGPPAVTFQGKAGVEALRLVDRILSEDFLKWNSLSLNEIDFGTAPEHLRIKEIVLDQPFSKVAIAKDRSTNLQAIFSSEEQAEKPEAMQPSEEVAASGPLTPPPASEAAPPDPAPGKRPSISIRVDTVRVKNGSLNFSDLSLEPGFSTGIKKLTGSIKGLSTGSRGAAIVVLQGNVDGYAPVVISGQLNPFSDPLSLDISLSFQGIELASFTPYAGKYAGYQIDKGKLWLDLKYKVLGSVLEGENKVLLDQFTFGQAVDSPDATNLPVRLAVTLLKDVYGKINVDVPVRGDMSDPEFSYGRALWEAVKTLIVKVAASPFTALASLTGGGGEELGYVAFVPGTAALAPSEASKLDRLAGALKQKPELRLEIQGIAAVDADTAALRENRLAQRVRAERSGAADAPVDWAEKAVRRVLKGFYEDTFRESAGTLLDRLRLEGKISDPAREDEVLAGAIRERLVGAEPLDGGALRALAQDRATVVKSYLIEKGQMAAEALFLKEIDDKSQAVDGSVRTLLSLSAD
ncbi:MAG: DUF748 domain-containing protein [Bdellovibrionota bacterium]